MGRLFAVIVAALSLTLLITPSASANVPGCVTKAEFDDVRDGWTESQLYAMVGADGPDGRFRSGTLTDVWLNKCGSPNLYARFGFTSGVLFTKDWTGGQPL